MPKHVLVAVDSSPCAEEALEFASNEWPDAELTLVHVINPAEATGTAAGAAEGGFPAAAEEWYGTAEEEAENVLADAAERFDREVETHIEIGTPSKSICNVAEELGVDHIAIGSHGRTGIERVLLGSVAEGVVRRSPVPVTVVR